MTPLEMQELAQTISDTYEALEYQLMDNIIKSFMKNGEITATSQWKIKKLAEIGKLNKSNIAIMSETLKGINAQIEDILTTAALQSANELEQGFAKAIKSGIIDDVKSPEQSESVKQVTREITKQCKDSLNLTNRTMIAQSKKAYTSLVNNTSQLADEILNKSALGVTTGIESRQKAMLDTVKEFADNGITSFIDKSGRKWQPEGYVNMVMRTQVSNTANGSQMAHIDDYGIDLIEVSSHSGSRQKCEKDQGKIYSKSGKSKKYPPFSQTSYGQPDGLLGINCGHSIYPYIEGSSIRRYFPEDKAENDEQYIKLQGQRQLERDIRKAKREKALFEEVGDTEGIQKAEERIKLRQSKIREYCKANDLPRRNNREQIR